MQEKKKINPKKQILAILILIAVISYVIYMVYHLLIRPTDTFIIENGQKPTEEQLKEVEEAKKHPIVFDKDCQELSPAMMKAFKSAVIQRNRNKKA